MGEKFVDNCLYLEYNFILYVNIVYKFYVCYKDRYID